MSDTPSLVEDASPRPWSLAARSREGDVFLVIQDADRVEIGDFDIGPDSDIAVTAVNERDALIADRDRLALIIRNVEALALGENTVEWTMRTGNASMIAASAVLAIIREETA